MVAKKIGVAPPLAAGLWLQAETAWAGAGLPVLTPDDNLGLLALISGMLAFWFYFRVTADEPR
jgi:hypothetical protein